MKFLVNGCLCLIVVLLLQFGMIAAVHHHLEQQLSMSKVHGEKDLIDKEGIDFRRPKYIKIVNSNNVFNNFF